MQVFPILISSAALIVSIVSLSISLWRGKLRMTHPMFVGFLHEEQQPKVFFRAMLYTTGKRGRIIEALHVQVRRNAEQESTTFSYWMYGETKELKIGSGLRIGEDGVAFNHHLLPPKGSPFTFRPGEYAIEVYARIVDKKNPALLAKVKVSLTEQLAESLADRNKGVLFTWEPGLRDYHADISEPPTVGRERSISGSSGKVSWP
jgi:hypothetical protein